MNSSLETNKISAATFGVGVQLSNIGELFIKWEKEVCEQLFFFNPRFNSLNYYDLIKRLNVKQKKMMSYDSKPIEELDNFLVRGDLGFLTNGAGIT